MATVVHGAALIDESQVGLVHERGRLQGDVPSLSPKVCRRPSPQLLVDQREEPFARPGVAASPGLEQLGDLVVFGAHKRLWQRIFRARRRPVKAARASPPAFLA